MGPNCLNKRRILLKAPGPGKGRQSQKYAKIRGSLINSRCIETIARMLEESGETKTTKKPQHSA